MNRHIFYDLKADGPIVIDVPPGLQRILEDFFSGPSARKATSMAASGAATWVCQAQTRAWGRSTSSYRHAGRSLARGSC